MKMPIDNVIENKTAENCRFENKKKEAYETHNKD